MMKWIGLTGGIATGKSTVSKILQKSGYNVIDADQISHEIMQKDEEGYILVAREFGTKVLNEAREIDRKKLGNLIFNNLEMRKKLEKLLHPIIQRRVEELKKNLESKGTFVAFYDVPLLYEKNLEGQFDSVVCVASSALNQLERLKKRDGLPTVDAIARINSQLPIAEKSGRADHVIWNDGDLNDLEFQVREFLTKIGARS